MKTLREFIEPLAESDDLKSKVADELKRFTRFKDDFVAFDTELQRMLTQIKSSPSQTTLAHITARISDLKDIGDAIQKVKNTLDFG